MFIVKRFFATDQLDEGQTLETLEESRQHAPLVNRSSLCEVQVLERLLMPPSDYEGNQT